MAIRKPPPRGTATKGRAPATPMKGRMPMKPPTPGMKGKVPMKSMNDNDGDEMPPAKGPSLIVGISLGKKKKR